MKFPIGAHRRITPSIVAVEFHGGIPLAYYNDRFDVKPGDTVFVEGRYEGVPGKVQKVSTRFQVDLEDYKRVLGVADTKVRGTFRQAKAHFITFDRGALPYKQVLSWFKPPESGGSFIQFDEEPFFLDDLVRWPFRREIMERGDAYYRDHKVVYLALDGDEAKAIVTGTRPYEVSFRLEDEVSDLTCDCPCCFPCKHEAAALLQLREALDVIYERYVKEYEASGRFAVIDKGSFFRWAVDQNGDTALELR